MAFCPKCGTAVDPNAQNCPNCGSPLYYGAPVANPSAQYDHTAEFDAKDISENKCYALLPYLFGIFGILVTAILSQNSPFVKFHLRQAIKFEVVGVILIIASVVLVWTIIVPLAAVICNGIIFVLKVIMVIQIFGNKAKEPAIIRELKFLD